MMKKNFQATEKFLASQDKESQERMEFTKTQGKFFEKVLDSLENQRQKHRFIIDNFYQSAIQLPNLYKKNAPPKEATEEVREWPKLSLLKSIEQPMTQDKMQAVCKFIKEASLSDDFEVLFDYAIIDFREGYQTWKEKFFLLSHSVVAIGGTCDQMENFDFPLGSRLDATVYIHNNGFAQAFLEAKGTDNKKYFFELSHFSILFLLDEDYREIDHTNQRVEGKNTEESTDTPVDKMEDRQIGMFTLFDKAKNLFYVTTY